MPGTDGAIMDAADVRGCDAVNDAGVPMDARVIFEFDPEEEAESGVVGLVGEGEPDDVESRES